jgi:thiamine pyrophosphokinase
MKVLIVGSGSLPDNDRVRQRFHWADLVIAADGGGASLASLNLMPHVLLGDFDSISSTVFEDLQGQQGVEVLPFPIQKDFTDMELALELAIERGATELVLLGASGTRLDHTLGNILMLYPVHEKGIEVILEDSHNQIRLLGSFEDRGPYQLILKKQENHKVSLLSLTPQAEGVTTQGLFYPLHEATLYFGSSRGISNEFIGDTATVSLRSGLLLVTLSTDGI